MTKAKLKALERIFSAEINDRLPFQWGRRNPKIALELEADGLIQRMTITSGGRFSATIPGWALTHAGRYLYCSSLPPCPEVEKVLGHA